MAQFQDLTGQRFGRLVVLYRDKPGNDGATRWVCRCDCGNLHTVRAVHLKRGAIVSCGCYRKEIVYPKLKKHGLCKLEAFHRLYRIWSQMKDRCSNPKASQYHLYGGKGITVCDEWKDHFEIFARWALFHGYADNLTIDRIDSNKNYCPENCQWLTRADNARKAVKITNFKRWGFISE